MPPATRDLTIYRGDDYSHTVTIQAEDGTPEDVSGSTRAAQFRRHDRDETAVDFTVDTTNAATGVIVHSLTAAQIADLPPRGVYDLQRTTDGEVETYLAGDVTVTGDVTR